MATGTMRDQIWTRALKITHRKGPVTTEQLAEITGASERTVRDTLNTMADNFVLERQKDGREVTYVEGEWMDL